MAIKEFQEDTIVAVSTPPGEGGIGVVRLSGKEAVAVVDVIFRSKAGRRVRDQKSFTVQYGHAVCGSSVIDEVLVLLMRAPKSYTCEDIVEISAHGGRAVMAAIVEAALKAGARLAAPGEFTKRAFLNGRIDLVQAEAVLDLIQAKTELGRRWATARLEGSLSEEIAKIKNELIGILSHLEASIDFPDDGLETEPHAAVESRLKILLSNFERLLESANAGILAKTGLAVVLCGRPNVGKSSLMNRLVGSSRVIVTPYPGTTRDVVEEEIQIQGFPVRIQDTAGFRDADHPIEKEGIERSRKALASADLVLWILDGSQAWTPEDAEFLKDFADKKKILVVNKSDLPKKLDKAALAARFHGTPVVESSCVASAGTEVLEKEIHRSIIGEKLTISEEAVVGSARQKHLLEQASEDLKRAAHACREGLSGEFVAADVRLALDRLGALVGDTTTDDVLEVLFGQFCIGK